MHCNDVNDVYTTLTGTPMILAEEMTDTNQCNPMQWCEWCEHYTYRNTFVMFAKEIFDYPELEEHPLLCNHLGKEICDLLLASIETFEWGCLTFRQNPQKKLLSESILFKYRWLLVKMEKREASVAVQSFMWQLTSFPGNSHGCKFWIF